MKTILLLFAILTLSCSEPMLIDSVEKSSIDSLKSAKYSLITDFSEWTSFGYPKGWYMEGNPIEWNGYLIENITDQCKITIKKEDILKNAYLKSFDLMFQQGHTYKISLDIVDISQVSIGTNSFTALRIGIFTGDITRFISWEFWPKTSIVKHYEWTIIANTVEPQQCKFWVVIPFGYVFPQDQWVIIDNLNIEEL